jgi:hypothetical protein
MSDVTEGMRTVGMLGFIMFIIARTFVMRGVEGRAFRKGCELSEAGDHRGALSSFLDALAAWGLNEAHATSAQFVKDFKRLSDLLLRIHGTAKRLGTTVDISGAQSTIVQLVNIYSDTSNLTFISANLKDALKPEVRRLMAKLDQARAATKAACAPLIGGR